MATGRTGAERGASDGLTLDSFGGLLSLLLALAAPLYPLGVFVLLLQLSAAYALDFATAAYAVAQMPTPVVVGQGVGIVFGEPLILVCAALPVVLAFRGRLASHRWERLAAAAVALVAAVALLGAEVIPALAGGEWPILGGLAVAGGAGWFAAQVERRGRGRIASSPVRLLLMPPIIYAGIAGYSITLAVAGLPPPLPRVALGAGATGQATATGSATLNLVGHSGGYWYGFTESDRRLLAIPDGVAGNAAILPAPIAAGRDRALARVALPLLGAVGAAVFCALALRRGDDRAARRVVWGAAIGGGIAIAAALLLAYTLLDGNLLPVAPLAGVGWLVALPVARALIERGRPDDTHGS